MDYQAEITHLNDIKNSFTMIADLKNMRWSGGELATSMLVTFASKNSSMPDIQLKAFPDGRLEKI
jgi:hypothetical protein